MTFLETKSEQCTQNFINHVGIRKKGDNDVSYVIQRNASLWAAHYNAIIIRNPNMKHFSSLALPERPEDP